MRHFALTISTLFFLNCATTQTTSQTAPQTAPPAAAQGPQTSSSAQAQVEGGATQAASLRQDGSSFERAIVIEASNELEGVPMEYRWLAEHFPGYRMQKQSLTNHDGRPYDILHFTDASGTERQIYFDISKFFGKM